jgi:hypothetical protein
MIASRPKNVIKIKTFAFKQKYNIQKSFHINRLIRFQKEKAFFKKKKSLTRIRRNIKFLTAEIINVFS